MSLAKAATEPGVATEGFIPLSVPSIEGNEWTYIKQCLDTGWVSSVGTFVTRFEEQLAACIGASQGVATVNGTAALHVALLVAGLRPDDEVLVSTLTFIAPVNAIRYVGAWPVFLDAEPVYWQMDVEKAKAFLELECQWKNGELWNKTTGRRVKALLPIHVLGHPVDMSPLMELARKWNLVVIEDATESLGAKYGGISVGNLGDISCFSFNGNKLITCGGGGMIATNNQKWAEKAKYLTTQAKDDPLEYVHHEIGYNYRLTNVLAAMGCAQLERLDQYIRAKREHAQAYASAFSDLEGITVMQEAPDAFSVFWMYTILVDREKFGIGSRELMKFLENKRIQTRPLWQPVHLAHPYRKCHAVGGNTAERLNRDALSLPCSVGLSSDDRDRVIEAVRQASKQRSS